MAYPPCRYAQRWPELFAALDDDQKWAVSQSLANGRLEGWEPTREQVADLAAAACGVLSSEEHMARTLARARQAASGRQAAATG